MTLTVPREELSNLLSLARELAQMMDAEQNADDEELVEVRLLRAVEGIESHVAGDRGADVGRGGNGSLEGGA